MTSPLRIQRQPRQIQFDLNLIVSILFLPTAKSGVTDYYAVDDEHALFLARQSVKNLNRLKDPQVTITAPKEPLYDPQELYGIVGENLKKVSGESGPAEIFITQDLRSIPYFLAGV